MGSAVDQLLSLRESPDRYDMDQADLVPLQLDAANERLQERIEQLPLLHNRSQSSGVTKIVDRRDLIPLLFAHSAYKSYSEAWLRNKRWDRMAKWIRTVSTYPVDGLDLDGIGGLDDFIQRLENVGYFVTCSSGTSGKPALIACSKADMEISAQVNVESFTWATGVAPEHDRKFFGLGPRLNIQRNEYTRLALINAYSSQVDAYQLPVDPISVESIMAMVSLRRRIGDGSAHPSEVAAYEDISRERQAAMDAAISQAVDALIASRDCKLLLTGMFASLYDIAKGVRAQGYSGSDFQDDTALIVGGGLKGAALPGDYREYIYDTFNITHDRVYHFYSMQEINSPFPKCVVGRYHVPPWVIFLPLDEPGEKLLEVSDETVSGRAAFFDVSLDGRWGGVISGDRVSYEFSRCACGHQGPTIGDDIVRYADLVGEDKISCAGTIDAYVRGEG